ncbi:MAG: extracellular solute-binding protein [Clostridia bacterium]|nr:extracellular solute-binding protein [Clostridia bacterium]
MKKVLACILVLTLLCGCALAEGSLVLYYSHASDWSDPIIQGFSEKYDVDVELVGLGTGELISRIIAESANPQADILWGGVVESYIPIEEYLASYESPQIPNLQAGTWDEDNFKWYPFDLEPMVMIYNTELVEEAPTAWADLLREEFKGTIASADPVQSSSAFGVIQSIIAAYGQENGGGYEFLEKLVPQLDGKLTSGSSAVYKGVSNGEYAVGLTYEEAALKYIAAGATIDVVYPSEGTGILISPVAMVNGAPNAENAKLFIDYVLSEEAQSQLAAVNRRSSRTDIALPDNFVPTAEIPKADYSTEWVVEHTEEFNEVWEDLITE